MSERRRILSRPRTRVYDCNYNIGERYYKPVVDSLDRKYNGGISDRLSAVEEPISRRSPFESRPARSSTANDYENGVESDVVSSIQRLKASRAARQELEDELDSLAAERSQKKRNAALAAAKESFLEDELDSAFLGRKKKTFFHDQLLDTVGVNGKLQRAINDEVSSFRKKTHSAIEEFDEDVPRMTRWTALKAGSMAEKLEESSDELAAKERARKSRARLADLDAEMDALAERGAAREKRIQGLRSLLAETSSQSEEGTSVQIKQRVSKTEKKVTF